MHAYQVGFRRVVGLALALAFLVATEPATAQTKLRWKFEAGQEIDFKTRMDMLQEMTAEGMPLTTKMDQQMDMAWKVKEVTKDGSFVIEQAIERIQIEIVPPLAGATPIKYDSESEELDEVAEKLAPLLGAMIGKPITLTIDALGEVQKIDLSEQMLEAIKNAGPAMGSMFSEESIKQMVGRGIFSFPEEVTAGQTWDSKIETANPILGKQIVTTEYKYVGPEEFEGQPVEKIDLDMIIKFDSPADAQAKVTMKDQSGDGHIYFDNKQGVPLETDLTSKMTLSIEIGGRTIEQSVTMKVSMKKVEPAAE